MRTSIRELLKQHGAKKECSVYRSEEEAVLDFPLIIGDFIKLCESGEELQSYPVFCEWGRLTEEKKKASQEYQRLRIEKQSLELDERNPQMLSGQDLEDKKRQLRQRKKALQKRERELSAEFQKEAWRCLGYEKLPCGLQYKNTVFLSTGRELLEHVPAFRGISAEDVTGIPFFVSHIRALKEALERGERIGMVGGPCLFGMDEVLVHITLENGEDAVFDCCCGRRCLKEQGEDITLKEYIDRKRERIAAVRFDNRKSGITRQEYDSIRLLFAFAEKLGAKVVIPLPDLSYFKYIESDFQGLPSKIRESKLEEFRRECYQITDLYLEVIEKLGKQHSQVEYTVLHEREQELCQKFYEKRKPYIEKSSYMKKITNVDGKKEAVVDYVTMLALPWYFYGTRHVVQLDSVDETDSGRKCRKIHKEDIKLTQILYPEYLSGDGKHSIYQAPLEFKDYEYVKDKGQ